MMSEKEGGQVGGKLTESQIAQLKDFFQGRKEIALALLFGSQSRGSAGPLSDVDIAVLVNNNVIQEDYTSYRLNLTGELAALLHRDDIDVVLINQAPPLLRHRIARDGWELSCKEPDRRTKFLVDTVREYLDTEPLRRVQEEYLVKRIREGRFGRPIPFRRVDDRQ